MENHHLAFRSAVKRGFVYPAHRNRERKSAKLKWHFVRCAGAAKRHQPAVRTAVKLSSRRAARNQQKKSANNAHQTSYRSTLK
jgi:hypothetical protein